MASFDRCRRAASIVLVMACFVLAPGVALAQFKSTKAPTLSVSTDTMDALTAVAGTFVCSKVSGSESVSISVTGFTDTGPLGSTYTYSIYKGATFKTSGTSTTHTKTIAWTEPDDGVATTWTIRIQAGLSSWTGPVASKAAACVKGSNNSGALA